MIRRRAGSGEPVVLIHGLGSYGGVWNPVLPALEAKRDVLVVDMPGFGDAPPGETTVPGLAEAVARDMDEAGLETAHLVGNSLGGWVSFELAKRGRARTVLALSPAGMWSEGKELVSRVQLLTAFWAAQAGARIGLPAFRNPRVRRALQYTFRLHGDRSSAEEVLEATRAFAHSKGFIPLWRWTLKRNAEGLDQVRCPTLIAWAEHDRLLNKRQGPRFVEAIDGCELRILPDTGHLPMGDDPELVSRTILEFGDRFVPAPETAAP